MATQYDKRTGAPVKAGTTIDYTNVNPSLLKYDEASGAPVANPNSNIINSNNLKPVSSPYVLPQNPPTTAANGLGEYIGSTTATNKTNSAAEAARILKDRETAQTNNKDQLDSLVKDLLGTNNDIASAGSTIDRSAEDKARKEADRLTSEIEGEQLSNRRNLEELDKNKTGLFGGGVEQEKDRVNRESTSHQADLAILQNSALRNYDTANAIADRQLELKLEPLKAKAENLKFFIDYNKEFFSKEDDRLYSEAQKKADNELKKQTDIETTITNLKKGVAQYAGSNAPNVLLALSKLDTSEPGALDKALAIAGQYQEDPLDRQIKQLQASKLRQDLAPKAADQKVVKINGQDYIQNADGTFSKPKLPVEPANQQAITDKVKNIDKALNSNALSVVVGPNMAARGGSILSLTGATSDFNATIDQITSDLTLDKLISAKAQGATFGALSEGELGILAGAATKLNSWKKTSWLGNTYYDTSETAFKEELNTIKTLTERAKTLSADEYVDSLAPLLNSNDNLYLNAGYLTTQH